MVITYPKLIVLLMHRISRSMNLIFDNIMRFLDFKHLNHIQVQSLILYPYIGVNQTVHTLLVG